MFDPTYKLATPDPKTFVNKFNNLPEIRPTGTLAIVSSMVGVDVEIYEDTVNPGPPACDFVDKLLDELGGSYV